MRRFEVRMKSKMEGEIVHLNRWIATLKDEPWAEELELTGDNTPLNDEAESAEMAEEQESRLELLERLIGKTTKLDAALRKISEGSYGICESCGNGIHRERLEALPEADVCLECQLQWERLGKTAEHVHANELAWRYFSRVVRNKG